MQEKPEAWLLILFVRSIVFLRDLCGSVVNLL